MKSQATLSDYIQVHVIVLIWGFTSILGKLISLDPAALVFWRVLLTFVSLLLISVARPHSDAKVRLGLREILYIGSSGLIIAAHWVLFFLAARLGNISWCLAGIATCSLWTAILEPLMNGRKISVIEVGLGVLVILGLGVLFSVAWEGVYYWFSDQSTASSKAQSSAWGVLGLLTGVAAAFVGAIFSVVCGKLIRVYHARVITQWQMAGAVLGTGLYVLAMQPVMDLPLHQLVPMSFVDWQWLIVLALVCTVYPYVTTVGLMKRFSAFAINLVINLEPIYGIVLAWLLFPEHEKMSAYFYAGTSIILLAVFAHPLLIRWQTARKPTLIIQ